MDSILKNIGHEYITEFQPNLLQNLLDAYKLMITEDQQRIKKLVNTWKNQPRGYLFPAQLISSIEKAMLAVSQAQATPASTTYPAAVLRGNGVFDSRGNGVIDLRSNGAIDSRGNMKVPGIGLTGMTTSASNAVQIQNQISVLINQKKAHYTINPSPAILNEVSVLDQVFCTNKLYALLATPLDENSLRQIGKQILAMMPPPTSLLPLGTNPGHSTGHSRMSGMNQGNVMQSGMMSGMNQGNVMQLGLMSGMNQGNVMQSGLMSGMNQGNVMQSGLMSGMNQGNIMQSGMMTGMNPGNVMQSGMNPPQPPAFSPYGGFNVAYPTITQDIGNILKTVIDSPKTKSNLPYPNHQKKSQKPPKQKPKIFLSQKDIQRVHPDLYYFLYDAIELQCKQCAIRFPSENDGKAVLQSHLDWHFRQNRRQKDKTKKTISRDWYLTISDWILEQPVEPLEKSIKNLTSPTSVF
jgi:hypothetical protein